MTNFSSFMFLQKINLQICFFVICIALLCLFLIVPLSFLFIMAFLDVNGDFVGLQNFTFYLHNSALLISLKNTLFVSLTSTFFGVGFAMICAYAILRTNIRFKKSFYNIAMFPLFVPNLMYSLGLVYLFGNQGIITTSLGIDIPIYGFLGIVIAQSIYIFPQSFLILYLGLQSSDYRMYEQANIMGISPFKSLLILHCQILNSTIKRFSCIFYTLLYRFWDTYCHWW